MDDDPGFFVKVLDFGLAKALEGAESPSTRSLTRSGTVLGTPRHMSPEQAVGGVVDSRSDLWSMAVIAFVTLTGRLPFDGKTIPALLRSICFDPIVVPSRVARVPNGFDHWFAKAVCRDPEQRFQTAKELIDALEPVLVPPVVAAPVKAKPRPLVRRSSSDDEPTLKILTGANRPSDRRGEARMPSSIPAAINGQRDLRNTGLIRNASRNGALLATRHRCYPDQIISLTLYVQGPQQGVVVTARVLRVTVRSSDSMWRFDVALQFDAPLDEKVLFELARRANQAAT